MEKWWLVLLALAAGAVGPFQAGANARLSESSGGGVTAGLLTAAVALVAMLAVAAVVRPPVPSAADLARAPWWAWAGGVLGAAYVVAALVLAPRLGAAAFGGFVLAGMLFASVAVDHLGLVGFEPHPVNWPRAAGLALLVAGVYLVHRY